MCVCACLDVCLKEEDSPLHNVCVCFCMCVFVGVEPEPEIHLCLPGDSQ